MQEGLVFNIQKFSVQDGPGIRTTVFLKGCPLSCWWCHNPESKRAEPEILLLEQRCIGCGQCADACPFGAPVTAAARNGDSECLLCGACVDACPAGARQMVGGTMTVDRVLAEVRKDRVFYEQSGGGVTFSGGEPLQQHEFLMALLEACGREELHRAVDTSGAVARDRLLTAAPHTDLFLYDVKVVDAERHRALTGVPNDVILENLRALGEVHGDICIRVPVIPGVNDDADNLRATARLAADIDGVRQVQLLPYHRTGVQKFERVGQSYRLADVQPPSHEHMNRLAGWFHEHGIETTIGGRASEHAHRETEA